MTDGKWKGKVALAYPLFGTTATHVAALYAGLGKDDAESYLKALRENNVLIVDGNAVVCDLVVEGRIPLGFTDTDDVNVAIQAGKPVSRAFRRKTTQCPFFFVSTAPSTFALSRSYTTPKKGPF